MFISGFSQKMYSYGLVPLLFTWNFPDSLVGKESPCNAGDHGSIAGLGRYREEGKGYPLQYSGLENSMDCIVHGVAKSWTLLRDSQFHFQWRKEAGSVPWHLLHPSPSAELLRASNVPILPWALTRRRSNHSPRDGSPLRSPQPGDLPCLSYLRMSVLSPQPPHLPLQDRLWHQALGPGHFCIE